MSLVTSKLKGMFSSIWHGYVHEKNWNISNEDGLPQANESMIKKQ